MNEYSTVTIDRTLPREETSDIHTLSPSQVSIVGPKSAAAMLDYRAMQDTGKLGRLLEVNIDR